MEDDAGANDYVFWACVQNRWTGPESELCDKEFAKRYAATFSNVRVARTQAVIALDGLDFDGFHRRLSSFFGQPLVAKPTHRSGDVIFLKDPPDTPALKAIFDRAQVNYFHVFRESQYASLEKKIIIEEDLSVADGHAPADYKFHCSRGLVIYCQHDLDRFTDHRRAIIGVPDFRVLPYRVSYDPPVAPVEQPASWDRTLAFAAEVSQDFDYVRVDLYDIGGEMVFGEFTFTPGASCGDQYAEWAFEQEVLAQILGQIARARRGAADQRGRSA